ncbi:hypothetical protein HKW67_21160 [Gemmatimonas groenlandica]|uniref:Tetracycline repressor TetR C-terminal domain-containing protein n=1 Tax=Gemmatimonas groenlandica TaxID=2732249 RepID=A0A6M4IY95_9BACT|nr:hypothetical protein HKW67_21160 [Gemmatimonas groenlandica]
MHPCSVKVNLDHHHIDRLERSGCISFGRAGCPAVGRPSPAAPRFPHFAALLTTPPGRPSRTMDESFEFGLARVLDGIERYRYSCAITCCSSVAGTLLNRNWSVPGLTMARRSEPSGIR